MKAETGMAKMSLAARGALVALIFLSGCARAPVNVVPAAALVPEEMRQAGFWISRIDQPDRVILTAREIARFNSDIRGEGLTVDLISFNREYDGAKLSRELSEQWEKFPSRTLFLSKTPVPVSWRKRLRQELALDEIPEKIAVRYGFTTARTEQRFLPVVQPVFSDPADTEFDELQNSSFDAGEPLVVLHESRDKLWVYAVSAVSRGWLKKDTVAFCNRKKFISFQGGPHGVVIAAKADIYLDNAGKRRYQRCRMGTWLALSAQGNASGRFTGIVLPARDEWGGFREQTAFVDNKDVSAGFLEYTPRAIITQAFKLLDAPYGWGGMHGEQDCSGFIKEIFATVGMELPRDSAPQAATGRPVETVEQAIPGITLLGMKGHILLFLGGFEGRPYAIHSVWSYRQPSPGGEIKKVIGRVAVTPLNLGEGSSKGSWLARINAVRVLDR